MRIIRNERGWAMPIALLLLVIVVLIAGVMVDYAITEMHHVVKTQNESRSHYLARSGAEAVAQWLIKDPSQITSRIASVKGKTSTNVKLDGVSMPVAITVNGTGSNVTVRATATIDGETSTVATRLFQIPELVAVGKTGDIYTYDAYALMWAHKKNSAGANWTSNDLNSVVAGISDNDNLFVTVGNAGTILVSATGEYWYSVNSNTSTKLNDVAFGVLTISGELQNRFVAVGNGGEILISSDGRTWNSVSSGTDKDLNGVICGDGKFVAVGEDGTALYSTNGTTWTAATWSTSSVPDSSINQKGIWHPEYYDYNDVGFANNRFVAVADKNLTEYGRGDSGHWYDWNWYWDTFTYSQNTPYLSYWATSGDGQNWSIISNRMYVKNGWTLVGFSIKYTYELYPQDLYCVAGNNNNFAVGGASGLNLQLTGQGNYEDASKLPARSEIPNPPPSFYGITYNMDKDQTWIVGNSKYVLHGANMDGDSDYDQDDRLSAMDIGAVELYDITATDIYSSSGLWKMQTTN